LRTQHRGQHVCIARAAACGHKILDGLAQFFSGVLHQREVIAHGPGDGLFERGGFFSTRG
jgi:hypothetical protein